MKQILLFSTLGNVQNSMENMHTDVRVLRIDTKKIDPFIIRVHGLHPLTLDKTGQFLFINTCDQIIICQTSQIGVS